MLLHLSFFFSPQTLDTHLLIFYNSLTFRDSDMTARLLQNPKCDTTSIAIPMAYFKTI